MPLILQIQVSEGMPRFQLSTHQCNNIKGIISSDGGGT